MRTIIDLPQDQLSALDLWRRTRGVSRAEAVRQAVAHLLAKEAVGALALDATSGLWRERDEDGLAMQNRLRGEWENR